MLVTILQVVKNVASKNIEVKKLVYVYLTRYAEEQQDLALLSISTFQVLHCNQLLALKGSQKSVSRFQSSQNYCFYLNPSIRLPQRALKDPNQLIRASALRVLSSIRVQMIVPIMLLAIKESAVDMSPFVRYVDAQMFRGKKIYLDTNV